LRLRSSKKKSAQKTKGKLKTTELTLGSFLILVKRKIVADDFDTLDAFKTECHNVGEFHVKNDRLFDVGMKHKVVRGIARDFTVLKFVDSLVFLGEVRNEFFDVRMIELGGANFDFFADGEIIAAGVTKINQLSPFRNKAQALCDISGANAGFNDDVTAKTLFCKFIFFVCGYYYHNTLIVARVRPR